MIDKTKTFDIEYKDENNVRIIFLPKKVDINYHILIKGRIIELLKNSNCHIVFDMEKTEFIDSSGISTIVMSFNLLNSENRKLFIANAKEKVKDTISIPELEKFIEVK